MQVKIAMKKMSHKLLSTKAVSFMNFSKSLYGVFCDPTVVLSCLDKRMLDC